MVSGTKMQEELQWGTCLRALTARRALRRLYELSLTGLCALIRTAMIHQLYQFVGQKKINCQRKAANSYSEEARTRRHFCMKND